MTWDIPVADDCPVCGHTMFKKSGKGFKKPYCINEQCANFTPEEKRGGYRKKAAAEGEKEDGKTGAAAENAGEKKPAAKKAAGAKAPAKKPAAKKPAARKSAAKADGAGA